MTEIELKETCCCGATLDISGENIWVASQHREFLKAHKGCREKWYPPTWTVPIWPQEKPREYEYSYQDNTGETDND